MMGLLGAVNSRRVSARVIRGKKVEYGLGIFAAGHLFPGEGGTQDYFRKDVEPPVRHKAAADDEA